MRIKDLRIIIDERERKSGIPKLLQKIGINVEVKTLPIGDYIVSHETVVERKSISDFISSIFDGRLFDQCNRLKEHFQFPIILLEGNVWDKKIKKNKIETLNYIKKNVPLNDFCKPEYIKSLCDYLLSSSGDFITGSNFIIDGGQVLNG